MDKSYFRRTKFYENYYLVLKYCFYIDDLNVIINAIGINILSHFNILKGRSIKN